MICLNGVMKTMVFYVGNGSDLSDGVARSVTVNIQAWLYVAAAHYLVSR